MFERPALLKGCVLPRKSRVWRSKSETCESLHTIDVAGDYCVKIANSNWDTRRIVIGSTVGVCDGIEIKSRDGLFLDGHNELTVTTGVGAYWDSDKLVLTLVSSPSSSRKVFYRILDGGVIFSNDLRWLINEGDDSDPVGCGQLLIYGSAGGHHSVVKGIKTVGFGELVSIDFGKEEVEESFSSLINYSTPDRRPFEGGMEDAIETIYSCLCSVLENICSQKVVLLLSGGVDSSLLAYLLKDVGAKDVEMFTCGFSIEDPDVQASVRLAQEVGYPHHLIMHGEKEAFGILDECVSSYPTPFADFSAIPSFSLVKEVSRLVGKGAYLIDGTAGDALFGFGGLTHIKRNRLLCKMPFFLKRIATSGYSHINLWKHRGFLARAVGALATSMVEEPNLSGITLTHWAGCLNLSDKEFSKAGEELLHSARRIISGDQLSNEVLLTALDFVHICGSLFSAKVAEPARCFGNAVEFPFMWPEVSNCGFSLPFDFKLYQGQVKYPLKKLLMKYIRPDYATRPKTGFTPHFPSWLTQINFNTWFQQAVERGVLLRSVLGEIPVAKMIQNALGNPNLFQDRTYNLIWTVAFAEKWFESKDCKIE